MVALKRFFQAERSSSISSKDGATRASNTPESDLSSNLRTSHFIEPDHPFQRIEKQFEVLHDQLQARPLSPRSPAPPSRASSRTTTRDPRHVDLLDALFSSHRYHIQSAQTLSPISPYNEDIAERNMTRFLQGQSGKPTVYSRILSALYQEDVADRNIARNKRGGRPSSRNTASRSRGNSFQRSSQSHQDEARCRPRSKAGSSLARSMSQEAPRSTTPPHADQSTTPRPNVSPATEGPLRQQRSVPNLSAEITNSPQRETDSRSGGFLGVPPPYKQGDTWSSTPLPDSPTLPPMVTRDTETSESHPTPDLPPSRSSRSRSSSVTSGSHNPSNAIKSKPKKNVRDLSINTELAARGKPSTKITHRAIQPPTPSSLAMKQNPSIAEVMNSPLPAGSPTSPSPGLQSDQKIAEIMDMFRQAYTSSPAISPHPTYETLQDAIIREINSHEAFQRVPLPESGPPFTPSFSQETFYPEIDVPTTEGPSTNRTMSLREGQISKLIRRGSFKKHRRGSDARRSISTTSVPSKVFWKSSETTSRRRHTDAPPPSPGFFNTLEQNHQASKESVAYMDLLSKARKSSANVPLGKTPDVARSISNPQPPATASLESANPAPSVFHMRAQASTSSINSRISFSAEDSDEEVIELPSVGIPKLQIHGIDENNVTYIAENTSPRNAFKLMSWPQRSGRSVSLRGNWFTNESSNSPSRSSSRGGLTTRSVASC
ncbi:hypothetical protein BDV27DRAFT_97666 [Aspergillus caelatus]|uniref:Uncharacterized protein n=1 Tax=Aspergillus caelatus TaxID=61420 RepID=A0A5N7AMY8_9EURO|nr:uncharacterized protein BDV27DRAFT_97666 [Aspergillus caelatus]KAE8370080.1 hypothetical protein BDV27DRAFT_97666 [Aspergillus caelatus]